MKTVWFDSHAHLADVQFDLDRKNVIEQTFSAGVSYITEIGEGPDEWEKARALAEYYPENVWWSLGLHPYYSNLLNSDLEKRMQTYVGHPRLVGLGEFGLDYAKSQIPKDVQIAAFRRLLDMASEFQLPIIIHCRQAYDDLLPILREKFEGGRSHLSHRAPGVIHCFSGTRSDAAVLVELGFFIGVDAPITYPNARVLREAISIVPMDRLVLETDCPYLPPQSRRGKRNDSSYLPETGAALAALRQISIQELSQITTQNALRLFGIKQA